MEAGPPIALVRDDGLARAGEAASGQHFEGDVAFVCFGWSKRPDATPKSIGNTTRSSRIRPIPRVRNGGWSLGCGRTRPELSPPNQGSSRNDAETRLR